MISIFDGANVGLPPTRRVPSMITSVERKLYFKLASNYRGLGTVYEIGPWLGSSTLHICAGLEASGKDWHLTCIDRFEWNHQYSVKSGIDLPAGGSFEHLLIENIANYRTNVTTVRTDVADIARTGHPTDPVELLFVDAPKNWHAAARMMESFGNRLIPGQSIILFQDFLHFGSYPLVWLSLAIPSLTPAEIVSDGCSAVTTLAADADFRDLDYASLHPRNWSLEKLSATWESFLLSVPAQRRHSVEGTFSLLLFELGYENEALAYAKSIIWRDEERRQVRKLHDETVRQNAKKARKYHMLLEVIAEKGTPPSC